MKEPTPELDVLIMTDSELSTAQLRVRAAILDDAQHLDRLRSNASVDGLTATLRQKIATLETINDERRFRRSFARSRR